MTQPIQERIGSIWPKDHLTGRSVSHMNRRYDLLSKTMEEWSWRQFRNHQGYLSHHREPPLEQQPSKSLGCPCDPRLEQPHNSSPGESQACHQAQSHLRNGATQSHRAEPTRALGAQPLPGKARGRTAASVCPEVGLLSQWARTAEDTLKI